MPTGYTAAIGDGIEFDKFVMQCARAMGACVMMRDEPTGAEMPEAFEPSRYNAEKLQEAKERLAELQSMTVQAATQLARTEYDIEVVEHEKRVAGMNELRRKYSEMLAKVQGWKAPSADHTGLKDFMVGQITQSIDFDCDTKYYHTHTPELKTGEEWLSAKIKTALRDIDYHTQEQAKEEERTAARNLWLKQLRTSLYS
jgi:hypothetical protein